VLKGELVGRPIGESISAGQTLIADAQSGLMTVPQNRYTDLLLLFADALRELLEELRD
jgi:hypothetical protein